MRGMICTYVMFRYLIQLLKKKKREFVKSKQLMTSPDDPRRKLVNRNWKELSDVEIDYRLAGPLERALLHCTGQIKVNFSW